MIALICNIITFFAVIIVNIFSETLPLNGQTTGDISNKLDVLITPAGYTFIIWFIIYFLCGIWIIRQIPKQRRNMTIYKVISPFFIMTNILNCAWIFLWHYEQFFASVIIMLALLLTLLYIFNRLKKRELSFLDYAPFSIYFSWVSIAFIVNLMYYATYKNWIDTNLSGTLSTISILIAFSLLSWLIYLKSNDWLYPLVTIWAFIGISNRNFSAHYNLIAFTAFIAAILLLVLLPIAKKNQQYR